jgi:hypothetical protein
MFDLSRFSKSYSTEEKLSNKERISSDFRDSYEKHKKNV